VLESVRKTRRPVRIACFGKPVAEIVPPSARDRPPDWLGPFSQAGRIQGDIVLPAADERDWEVPR
jgi:antitoxin (DNA-binding transcriptional repressor) of toxin-antitoxin stability system